MSDAETAVIAPQILAIIERCQRAWHASASKSPRLGRIYARLEQQESASRVDAHLDAVDSELKKGTRTPTDAEYAIARITSVLVKICNYALDVDDLYVNTLLQDGFSRVGFDLARRARRMDPAVSMADILQAARNAWTACALQIIFGKRMRLTPSIFAYSMLYPYSDNYLDDVAVGKEAKLDFSRRFRLRLQGSECQPLNDREEIIWELVTLIESEYPRPMFPGVYDSLLAIHHAQEESIRQLKRGHYEQIDVAALTVTKGGTSVLADAYLAAGELTEHEQIFALYWGVLLQLGDDLQDFHSDRKRGSLTLFTQAADREPLDRLTNQTLCFGEVLADQMRDLPECPPVLKGLLAKSSRMLLIRSVASAASFYSDAYLADLERFSPFDFEFLRAREQRFARSRRLYAALFEQALKQVPDREFTRFAEPSHTNALNEGAAVAI